MSSYSRVSTEFRNSARPNKHASSAKLCDDSGLRECIYSISDIDIIDACVFNCVILNVWCGYTIYIIAKNKNYILSYYYYFVFY